ncbi:MAG: sugar transferase [Solibacillus sp.]
MQHITKLHEKRGYEMRKRLLDVIMALIALLILSPLLLLIACAVKIECWRSPVIFRQTRIGLNGKPFAMYKFRSMVDNAELLKAQLLMQNEATGPVFKIKQDPRITRVGRFIRRTSLDELPQLLNVVKGEMSFVGPRPALPEEVQQYSSYEQRRLSVIPGLTCYWQISGRNKLSFSEWVALDLKYIEERSFFVDMKLIIKTTRVLFGSNDAY